MKCYTAFIFEEIDPDLLHCTHKYLGDLSDNQIAGVRQIVDQYFRYTHIPRLPQAVFSKEDFFGPNKEVRVLKPRSWVPNRWLLDLRNMLGNFRKDDFDSYQPHVTTLENIIDLPFSSYALIGDKQILGEWK